jgi:monoamine oxidase
MTHSELDVIVIGGGFAGITAARDCQRNGYKTLVLEAQDRLGGRTWTAEFGGEAIELGGTWVYNCQPFVWSEIIRYGLEIEETPGAVPDEMILLLDGKRVVLSEEQLEAVVVGWMQFTEAVRIIVPRPYDLLHNTEAALAADQVSALAHLESISLSPIEHAFCKGVLELVASGPADSVSYLDILRFYMLGGSEFSNFMDSAARFKLKKGTAGLLNAIAEEGGAGIELNTQVRGVEDRGEHVIVKTSDGSEFRARVVVSTLPMNVIADVDFKPALPNAVIEAAQERHPGRGGKFFLKVEGQIGNIATVAPSQPINYLMTFSESSDHTMLVAFTSDMDLVEEYNHETLQRELNVHVPGARLLSSKSHDWNSDEYAKGTWATYRPGWARQLIPELRKSNGRIHFASGDHGEGWRGTIDGAIGAGVQAAHAIRNQLG